LISYTVSASSFDDLYEHKHSWLSVKSVVLQSPFNFLINCPWIFWSTAKVITFQHPYHYLLCVSICTHTSTHARARTSVHSSYYLFYNAVYPHFIHSCFPLGSTFYIYNDRLLIGFAMQIVVIQMNASLLKIIHGLISKWLN
jgi:hypothetical protein